MYSQKSFLRIFLDHLPAHQPNASLMKYVKVPLGHGITYSGIRPGGMTTYVTRVVHMSCAIDIFVTNMWHTLYHRSLTDVRLLPLSKQYCSSSSIIHWRAGASQLSRLDGRIFYYIIYLGQPSVPTVIHGS